MQIAAPTGADDRLLAVAAWCETHGGHGWRWPQLDAPAPAR
jgi:Asp-tRNA(Asn)/Glu-tRNA(Gln) amidotransferase A subunit family amidase